MAAGWLFFQRQRRLETPFLDPEMFASSRFSASLAINIVGFSVAFGSFLVIALYLQAGLGLTQ